MQRSLVLFLALSACQVSRGADAPIQQTIGASGGSITITQSQDPTLAGTQLVIPPGAVPDGTIVTISQGAPQNGAGEQAVSPSIRLQPDGLTLAKPATLFVPYPGQPARSRLLVEVTSLGKKSQQEGLLVSSAAGLAQLQINHFSDWQIVSIDCPPAPTVDLAQSPVDIAWAPYDLGAGSADLAPGGPYDFGPSSYDLAPGGPYDAGPGGTDLAPGGTWDGGDVADLAPGPAGYAPPTSCGDTDPVDLATYPVDLAQPKG